MADFRVLTEEEKDDHYDVEDFILDGNLEAGQICLLPQPYVCSVTIGSDVERDDDKVTVVVAYRTERKDPVRYERVFDTGAEAFTFARALASVFEAAPRPLNSRNFGKLLLVLGLTFLPY